MPKKKNMSAVDAVVSSRPLISGNSVVSSDGGEINSKEFFFRSGRQVLCEALLDGVYGIRYRNCTGQIVPDMHLGVPSPSFCVALRRPGAPEISASFGWSYEDSEKLGKCPLPELNGADGDSCVICSVKLTNRKAGLRVTVFTLLDGSDFIERWLEIENTADTPAALTDVRPFCGAVWRHNPYPEASGSAPAFSAAYTHIDEWGKEGDFYSEPLDGPVSVKGENGKSGWGRPAVWLKNRCSGETFVAEYGWSGNWKIDIIPEYGQGLSLSVSIGMLPAADVSRLAGSPEDVTAIYVLGPGEKVVTPAVHMALLRENEDRIVQLIHDHVREMVLPPLPDGVRPVEIEANHRGYLCDHESEEGIKRDMEVAAAYGVEMYVIDAGWYGSGETNRWPDNAGDWTPGVWLKNGLKPLVKYAHEKKMRFGLWCEIEAAGRSSRLAAEHPEWLAGRAIDLSIPEAEAHCLSELLRISDDYRLDMLRIDHNNNIGVSMSRERDGFVENTNWRYYEAFTRMMRKVRKRFPQLELQNCAGGGGRLDFMTMSLFHNTELSDWSRQPRSVRILDGATYALPPEIMLRIFGTESGDMPSDADIDSQLRGALMARPILRGLAPDAGRVAPWLDRRLRHNLDTFRSVIRPVLDGCLVYHHKPLAQRRSIMDGGYGDTVLEYASRDGVRAVIAVFRCAGSDDGARMTVFPKSVGAGHVYTVTWDNSGERVRMSGLDMMRNGIPVSVSGGMSELILLRRED